MGRVIVVGSTNMDVITQAGRLPRPGETVAGRAVTLVPGGKGANQAVSARRLGTRTILVGAVGTDAFGDTLRAFLTAEDVDTSQLAAVEGSSGTAVITVDEHGENTIVIVPGANGSVTADPLPALGLGPADVVLLQGEIPPEANLAAARHARAAGARVVLNLAPYRPTAAELVTVVDVIVVNEVEFAGLVPQADGIEAMPGPAALAAVRSLLSDGAGPSEDLVVTLGGAGMCARIAENVVTLAARHVPVVDTTGAGDCFCGAFGAALAGGLPAATALFHANLAASLAVQRPGAAPAMPTGAEVAALLDGRDYAG